MWGEEVGVELVKSDHRHLILVCVSGIVCLNILRLAKLLVLKRSTNCKTIGRSIQDQRDGERVKSVPFLQRAKFDADRGECDGACRAGSTSVVLFSDKYMSVVPSPLSSCRVYASHSFASSLPQVFTPLDILHRPSSSLAVASSLL